MVHLIDEEAPAEEVSDDPVELLRWRTRALWCLIGGGVLVPIFGEGESSLAPSAILTAILFWILLMLAALAPIACLYHLHVYAARHGGRGYANTQTALALLLTPFLVGIALVPLLVISDVRKGVAAHRKRHERGLAALLPEAIVWTLFGFGAPWLAVREFGAWGVPVGLLAGVVAARGLIALRASRAGRG